MKTNLLLATALLALLAAGCTTMDDYGPFSPDYQPFSEHSNPHARQPVVASDVAPGPVAPTAALQLYAAQPHYRGIPYASDPGRN